MSENNGRAHILKSVQEAEYQDHIKSIIDHLHAVCTDFVLIHGNFTPETDTCGGYAAGNLTESLIGRAMHDDRLRHAILGGIEYGFCKPPQAPKEEPEKESEEKPETLEDESGNA